MAITINGEHHRNPSGLNNKVNYLLVKSARNIRELDRVHNLITSKSEESRISWEKAFERASEMLKKN